MKKITTQSPTDQPRKDETLGLNNVVVELRPEMLRFARLYAQYRGMTICESVRVILRLRFYKVSQDLTHDPHAKEAMNRIAPGVADRILDAWKRSQIQSRSTISCANVGSEVADEEKVEVEPILAEFAHLYAEYAFKRLEAEAGSLGETESVNFILALFLNEQAFALLGDHTYQAEMDEEAPGIAGRFIQLAEKCFGYTGPRGTEGPSHAC